MKLNNFMKSDIQSNQKILFLILMPPIKRFLKRKRVRDILLVFTSSGRKYLF